MLMPRSRSFGTVRRRSLFNTLMSFPNACFIGALLTDIAYARSASMTWETFSVWLLTAGLIVAAVAVVVGLVQGLGRDGMWPSRVEIVGYAVALVLSIINAFVHSRDGYTSVVPDGIALSVVVVVIVLATVLFSGRIGNRRPSGTTA
ncbi:MAG: DUF2231 domain-containing protein [Janthinobacterium lividum]